MSVSVCAVAPADEAKAVDVIVLAFVVDPAQQGKGHGTAPMRHALARCDRDHLPAHLESTNPRNVPLSGHGFDVLGTIQAGSSLPIVPMPRKPR